MGRFDKRMGELKERQAEIQLQLERLDLADKQEHCEEKDFENDRKMIRRELTDVMIRMRNLQRNQKKEIDLKGVEVPPESEERCIKMQENLYTVDEGFNPEALERTNSRPEILKYPKIALPHSKPVWDRVGKVGRGGERRAAGRLTDWQGQFTGVDEEERRFGWQGREGRQWTWNKMNERSRSDEFESWREEKVEGYSRLDSRLKSPEVSSDQKSSPPGMATALPDVAHLKSLFPLNKTPATQEPSPDRKNLLKSSCPDQVFTKIKSRGSNNQISMINSIISQSSSINSKTLPVQTSKICDKNRGSQCVTRQPSECGHEEQKMPGGSTRLPIATNMITVRAKLSSPAVSPPLPSVAGAQAEPLREKLGKRLIRNKD